MLYFRFFLMHLINKPDTEYTGQVCAVKSSQNCVNGKLERAKRLFRKYVVIVCSIVVIAMNIAIHVFCVGPTSYVVRPSNSISFEE